MDPSIDIGLVYGACRERVVALVRDLSPAQADLGVPACPAWTVHDVVAHLAGTVADVVGGNLDGVGTDAWTDAQVTARTGVPIPELLAEWERNAGQFEDGLRLIGGAMANIAIADVWNHEQDLRGALGHEGGRDTAAELCAIDGGLVRAPVGGAIAAAGLPPLRCVAGTHEAASAEGAPGATLTAEPFEIARALVGRRTAEQLARYRWEGDAEPYIRILASAAPASPLPL